jgi:oligoribonuclease NrnB/cAMP/cGMP phosphodiesterase (DHH superfamily)
VKDAKGMILADHEVIDHNKLGFPVTLIALKPDAGTKVVFTYSKNVLEKISTRNDSTVVRMKDTWDSNDNLLEEKLELPASDSRLAPAFIKSFQYLEFDKHGNWIKCIIKEEKSGILIRQERALRYF